MYVHIEAMIINNHHIPSETMEKDRIDSQVTDHSQENFSIVFGAMGRDPVLGSAETSAAGEFQMVIQFSENESIKIT